MSLIPAIGEPAGHYFVEYQKGTEGGCSGAEKLQEGRSRGDAATRPLHLLDEDSSETIGRESRENGCGIGNIIVGCDDKFIGGIHCRCGERVLEVKHASMVSVCEDEDL